MREQDKLAILQANGCNLIHVMVDGVSVVTNSHVIMDSPPFTNAAVHEDEYQPKPESVKKYWRSLPERLGKSKPVGISRHFKQGNLFLFVAELTNKAPLNTGYLYLFDGCEMFSAGKESPAIFVRNGAIAGAVMPMRHLGDVEKCDPPTLEDVLSSIHKRLGEDIVALEAEIAEKRGEIKDLESEIAGLEKEIADIRKRREKQDGNLEQTRARNQVCAEVD